MKQIYTVVQEFQTPTIHQTNIVGSYLLLEDAKSRIKHLLEEDFEWILDITHKPLCEIEETISEPLRTIVRDGVYFSENRIEISNLYE